MPKRARNERQGFVRVLLVLFLGQREITQIKGQEAGRVLDVVRLNAQRFSIWKIRYVFCCRFRGSDYNGGGLGGAKAMEWL